MPVQLTTDNSRRGSDTRVCTDPQGEAQERFSSTALATPLWVNASLAYYRIQTAQLGGLAVQVTTSLYKPVYSHSASCGTNERKISNEHLEKYKAP